MPNLILNGDFERDLSAWTDLNNQVRVMPGIGVNASKAARFDPTFDPAGATWDAIGQILIVAPNTTYTFGAIASSTAGAGAVIVFEVGYADKTSTPVTIEIGREYKVHQAILKTKDKPGWASLQIRHYGGGGVLTIDNVFVQPRD